MCFSLVSAKKSLRFLHDTSVCFFYYYIFLNLARPMTIWRHVTRARSHLLCLIQPVPSTKDLFSLHLFLCSANLERPTVHNILTMPTKLTVSDKACTMRASFESQALSWRSIGSETCSRKVRAFTPSDCCGSLIMQFGLNFCVSVCRRRPSGWGNLWLGLSGLCAEALFQRNGKPAFS